MKTLAADQSKVTAARNILDQALPTLEKLRLITEAWEQNGLIKNGSAAIPRFGQAAKLAQSGLLHSSSETPSSSDEEKDYVKYCQDRGLASFGRIPKKFKQETGIKNSSWEKFKRAQHSFYPVQKPRNSDQYRDPSKPNPPRVQKPGTSSDGEEKPQFAKSHGQHSSDSSKTKGDTVSQETLALTKKLQNSLEDLRHEPSFMTQVPEKLRYYLEYLRQADPEELAEALKQLTVHGPVGLGQIETPVGYPLAMHVSWDDIRQSVIRFQEAVSMLGSSQKLPKDILEYGFDPAKLIESNAIDLPPSVPHQQIFSDLDNDVHPLFQIENFRQNAHDIYDCLVPALRLASKFLTERVVSLFWHTACFGERVKDTDMPKGLLNHTARRIRHPVNWTIEGEEHIKRLLEALSDQMTIDFTSGVEFPVERYAEHSVLPAKWPLQPRNQSRIMFGQDIYVAAKKLSVLKSPDPLQVLRFHFLFAVILVHEIAHAVEARHKLTSDGEPVEDGRSDNEAFYGEHEWCEAGRAWESSVFRGTFLPINKRVDAAHGLCIYDYPNDDLTDYFSVDMRYIWLIQRKDTWERELSPGEFEVPRNGALGKGSYFTPALFISDHAQYEVEEGLKNESKETKMDEDDDMTNALDETHMPQASEGTDDGFASDVDVDQNEEEEVK